MPKTVYVHYTSPTAVECCVVANSKARAAKALATTAPTLAARGKIYNSPEQVPEALHQGMALACERPDRVIVCMDGTWKPLSGDPANTLMDDRQRALKGVRNAAIGDSPMEIHSVTCDPETWAQFLGLGGSKWFRKTVRTAYKRASTKKE